MQRWQILVMQRTEWYLAEIETHVEAAVKRTFFSSGRPGATTGGTIVYGVFPRDGESA